MNIMKKNVRVIVRGITVLIALMLQIIFYVLIGIYLKEYATWIYVFLEIVSMITVNALMNKQESYRQFWVVIILTLPVLGLLLYFAWGRVDPHNKEDLHVQKIEQKLHAYSAQDPQVLAQIEHAHPNKVQIARYLSSEGFPAYENTKTEYFPLGEQMFSSLKQDLALAEKSIFMLYFTLNEGQLWDEIKAILFEKASQGLDVRLLLDDFGSILTLTPEFKREIQEAGIRLGIFAPIEHNVGSLSFNYRNHQKITVIDGNIGYCGGLNLADEYANIIVKYGHWKDTAVRLEGEGVWGLTSIFLESWEIAMNYEITADYHQYMPETRCDSRGFVQPFCDGPANNPKNPALDVYTHMINKARDYLYITTPYLVLDRRMIEDLNRAARSGVDVHILVPHIYDKWYVYMVNVANYGTLMENGVHIHEYTPGFIHSKTIVCDDECAVCGTINTDYRSFFLHYECGVYMCDCDAVTEIRDDIRETMKVCQEMDLETWRRRPVIEKIIQFGLKIFSPLF